MRIKELWPTYDRLVGVVVNHIAFFGIVVAATVALVTFWGAYASPAFHIFAPYSYVFVGSVLFIVLIQIQSFVRATKPSSESAKRLAVLEGKINTLETKNAATPSVPLPPKVNWAIWRLRQNYTLNELAAILAQIDPSGAAETTERAAYVALMAEEVKTRRLAVRRNRYAEDYHSPDLWPASFDVSRDAALQWAKSKGFSVEHIE
jgi:hypothetical protein